MPSLIWVNQFAVLPGDGGGTRHFELARELVQRDWKVTILASDLHLHARKFTRRSGSDRTTKVEHREGVEIRWLWAAPYERNNWQRARNWLTFNRSVLREGASLPQRPDIIIGSSPQLFAASAARAIASRRDIPFVLEVRDLWPESLVAAGARRGLAYRYLERVAARLYRRADRVLVLTRGVARYLADRGVAEGKIVCVPNGVDVTAVRPAAAGAQQAKEAPDAFALIYAGAHGPANGLETVLDAADILRDVPQLQFVLVGDGPAKAALQEDARRRNLSNVRFLDPVSKPDLVALLNRAHAGLMILRKAPLFSFGVSPNKLFDYLAAALPVVCNVPGEVAQMLEQSGAGIQVADDGGVALAGGVRKLMAMTSEKRQRMGSGGRDWVQREHSREVLGERLDTFLRQLL